MLVILDFGTLLSFICVLFNMGALAQIRNILYKLNVKQLKTKVFFF